MKTHYSTLKAFLLLTILFSSLCSHMLFANGIEFCFDKNGNEQSFIAATAITCNTSPVISCPSNYFGCPGENTLPENTGMATAVPGEADCPQPIISYEDVENTPGNCTGQVFIRRIWTARYTDDVNPWLFADCTQFILLEDNDGPQISNCPIDINLSSQTSCDLIAVWESPTAQDDCQLISLTSSHNSGDVFPNGQTTVTYTATDGCGNSSTCSFTVTIDGYCCSTAPLLSCPDDISLCPGSTVDTDITGSAIATPGSSDCDQAIVNYSDQLLSQSTCGGQIIERTWIATDPNNSTIVQSCSQIITLEDTQAPIFSICPIDITVQSNTTCEVIASWDAPIVNDKCSNFSVISSHNSGDAFPDGLTTVTYTATDDCGNSSSCSFNITAEGNCCTDPPEIYCPTDIFQCPDSDVDPSNTGYATAGTSSMSCEEPIITFTDIILSTENCEGQTIKRTWTATYPNSSLSSSCNQFISLIDNQNPLISKCPFNITQDSDANCQGVATWDDPISVDNCGVPNISSSHQSGDRFPIGSTMVTYTSTDACGNTASCSFMVTIIDKCCKTPPTLNCPSEFEACVGLSTDPNITGQATATAASDNCGDPNIRYDDEIVSQGPCQGAIKLKRTWIATDPDDASLQSSCTQIIILKDDIAPTFMNCPTDITISMEESPNWTPPSVSDNCDNDVAVSVNFDSNYNFPVGNTTVIYTATDHCNLSSTCSFVVTLNPPSTEQCQEDIEVDCSNPHGAIVYWNSPSLDSQCGDCNMGEAIEGFVFMGTFNGHSYYCSTKKEIWSNAQSNCVSNGGHLAVINSAAENTFLANLLTIQSAYIGLSDHQVEGNFIWVNNDPLNHTNWYPGQPNDFNNNQDYVELLNNGQWNDQYASTSLEYIMEIPCSNIVQTSGLPSGSNFPIGTTTIGYTLTDACGITSTCNFDVVVQSAISIQCPDDITLQCPSDASGINVTWNDPTVHSCCGDNCHDGSDIPGFMYMGSFNNNHYYCSRYVATWEHANLISKQNGGYLASINTAEENAFLANILTIQSAYIGLNDKSQEGVYQWSNGDPFQYNNWYPGQPNNYADNQDYVEMLSNGQWNDQYNHKALEFIMEMPGCVQLDQTEGPISGSHFETGSTTTITYIASDDCGNSAECSFNITIEKAECQSGGISSNTAWIKNVEFAGINNTTGNDGGYADYTHICASIKPNHAYTINLTPDYTTTSNVYWKVWIDWNKDGDFVDNGEYIAFGEGTTELTGTIMTPSNLWQGNTVMRVAMSKIAYPESPCDQFAEGETEDYCIHIISENLQSNERQESKNSPFDAALLKPISQRIDLSIAPNPAFHSFALRSDHFDLRDIASIRLYAQDGSIVKEINDKQFSGIIDIDDLVSGVYIMKTALKDGRIINKKVIVQK